MLAAKNSRERMPGSPAAAISAGTMERSGTNWFRVLRLVAALIIRKALLHRCFGSKTFGARFAKIVAALGTGVSVILPSLVIGIDQSIVAERRQTFG
jgi:hypothetical protein